MKIDYMQIARINRKMALAELSARKDQMHMADVFIFEPPAKEDTQPTPVFTSVRRRVEPEMPVAELYQLAA